MILLGIDANCNLSEGAGAAGIEVYFGWKSPSSFGATYFFFSRTMEMTTHSLQD